MNEDILFDLKEKKSLLSLSSVWSGLSASLSICVVVYLSLLLRVLFVPLEVGEMNEAECRVTDSDRHHAVKIIHLLLSICLSIIYPCMYQSTIRRREGARPSSNLVSFTKVIGRASQPHERK